MKISTFFCLLIACMGIISCNQESDQQADEKISVDPISKYLFVGTYTRKEGHVDGKSDGIHVLKINDEDGSLTAVGETKGIVNPSYLTLSANGKYLYAVNETGPDVDSVGSVSAFSVAPEGKALKLLSKQSSHSFAPCYVSVDNAGRYAFVANYVGGVVAMLPILENGSLGPASDIVKLTGTGPNPRQESSHPHSVVLSPDNRFAFVADLGTDNILTFGIDYQTGKLLFTEKVKVSVAPGAGPRHLVFHPTGKWAYVINELNNTITSFKYNASDGVMELMTSVSTLPDDFTGESYCAAIHISPDGRYVYGSNRGHNSIVAFSIDSKDGNLSLIEHEPTQGDFPRDFMIHDNGKFLYVANQNSDNIVIFRLEKGELESIGEVKVPTPVCLKMSK